MEKQKETNPLFDLIREAVRLELASLRDEIALQSDLVDPEELARRLKVPVSWVYEQSRLEKIPTHRIGRYLRFSPAEVIASQKKNKSPS